MKLLTALLLVPILTGCISSSSPAPPASHTTVVVPPDNRTAVICADGTKPPCS